MNKGMIFGQSTHIGCAIINKKAVIVSDNENYANWVDKVLIITHADNKGVGYDDSCSPEMLCDFKCEDGSEFPFSLYEYEFKLI